METGSGIVEGSILALSVTCGDSSPKGRALGKTRSFAVLPKPLPLGEVDLRSKDGEGEDAIHRTAKKALPSGELSSECETERVCVAANSHQPLFNNPYDTMEF